LHHRAVHLSLLVMEDPQVDHLVGQPARVVVRVALADSDQHAKTRPDGPGHFPVDRDRGLADPLDYRPHAAPIPDLGRSRPAVSPTAARGPPRRCGTAGATPRQASPTAARGPPRRCGTAGATPRQASPTAARGPPRRCGTAGATPRQASPTAARGPPRRCGTA